MSKKTIILMIVTVLCITATVMLKKAVDNSEPEYTEVKALVLSSESVYKKILGKKQLFHEVIVIYQGQEYELENAHNNYSFVPGRQVTAYLSGEKLYANIEGVKTSTGLATTYFVCLFASFAMVIVSLSSLGKTRTKTPN